MLWSNWQKAIWRGAMVAGFSWAGLAWAQTSAPPAGAERIMVVHENNKATRCRVLETWQLPDGRVAHLLQSTETGEMLTIVDEQAPMSEVKNPRSMVKRIFSWGSGRRTPPEGSPIPPQLRIDSGLVLKQEDSPPNDAVQTPGPAIVNRIVDDKALGSAFATQPDGVIRLTQKETVKTNNQVVEFNPPVVNIGAQVPLPAGPVTMEQPPAIPVVQALTPKGKAEGCEPAANPRLIAQPIVQPCPQVVHEIAPGTVQPCPQVVHEMAPGTVQSCPQVVYEMAPGTAVETTKRSWRPGDKLQAWLLSRSTARPTETIVVQKIEAQKPTEVVVKEVPPTPTKMEPTAKAPFSTAMPTATLPSAPTEPKKADLPPLAILAKPAMEKPAAAPVPEVSKPAPLAEKRDIWGTSPPAPALPAKKSPVDTAKSPEPKVDPLFAPERITPKKDASIGKATTTPAAKSSPQWPLNSQSVMAAKSGIQGPVTYVPYPIVTVPQPHHPPTPPDPKLPEAPQLNAFVNAFSPPPMPKGQGDGGQPGMMPQGSPMMAPQQMAYQQMMQQQMMQQAMAQQRMMPYGDPRLAALPPAGPNSMMAPYRPAMPSQGPTANYSRQYQGPMPPNLVAGGAPMQAGYPPAPNRPMMPPQQPILQQAGYQQPAPAQVSPAMSQVDLLIKTMREAPYPAQREWAAQQLVGFEWRSHPQILQAMLQSASQDPAVSVRAGCVYCLGRMQASVEPVLGALNAMRNDAEPRVRQEVEQALVRLGQAQAAAR